MVRDSWIDRLYEAAKRTGLAKRISLYDLREMAIVAKTIAPDGRVCIEMDESEYDRMREALGSDWEWNDVSMRFGAPLSKCEGGRDEHDVL